MTAMKTIIHNTDGSITAYNNHIDPNMPARWVWAIVEYLETKNHHPIHDEYQIIFQF